MSGGNPQQGVITVGPIGPGAPGWQNIKIYDASAANTLPPSAYFGIGGILDVDLNGNPIQGGPPGTVFIIPGAPGFGVGVIRAKGPQLAFVVGIEGTAVKA